MEKLEIENPQAFPSQQVNVDGTPSEQVTEGMTLRDYFAGRVLQGFVSQGKVDYDSNWVETSYQLAGEMLKERNKQQLRNPLD